MVLSREPSSSFNKMVPNMRYSVPTFSWTFHSYKRGRVGLVFSVTGSSLASLTGSRNVFSVEEDLMSEDSSFGSAISSLGSEGGV